MLSVAAYSLNDLGAKLRDVFGKVSPAPLICRLLSVGSSFPYFFPSQFLENDSFAINYR
ncbi:hypothetical protein HMPREF1548_03787 [Clostridium sp. KLE 1755]|nr:hypothetical protein HMPREF1548_03787 [Clostridium sp. KLE 1755]